MGSGLLIALREGLEIALILAIIVAYLDRVGQRHRLGAIWTGATAAVVVSVGTGLLFNWLVGEFEGKWEQLVEGALAFSAVGVLTWMIFWMRGHARGIASSLHARVDRALEQSFLALSVVAFVAVAREGFETVLFLLGAETSSASGSAVVVGGFIGLAIAAVLGYLFYLGSERVDLRKFFNWTGLLLILFAAGLFAKGIHEFREFFEFEAAWHSTPVWEITAGPLAEGWTYDFLRGLFGWARNPERIRAAGYLAYLLPILWFYFKGGASNPTPTETTGAEATNTEADLTYHIGADV